MSDPNRFRSCLARTAPVGIGPAQTLCPMLGQIALALAVLSAGHAAAQSANAGHDPNAGGTVEALVVEADGKTLVGGAFTSISGQPRDRICRSARKHAPVLDRSAG